MTASNEMIKIDQKASVLSRYSEEQLNIIRNNVAAPNFTDQELAFCLSVAEARNLDPLARQIYFTKRRQWVGRGMPGADNDGYAEKVAAEPTIDGFRVMADRTGEMAGYDDPVWCGPDGVWHDVWLAREFPSAAKVRVYRKGRPHSYSAIAKFEEYAQKKKDGSVTQMWQKMPANQLAKCAEALALRKAFPEQFGGLYSHEEMQQADNSKFDALPKEKESKPQIVEAAPSNVKQLSPPKAATKPAEAPKAQEKWTPAAVLPLYVVKACPALRDLATIPVNLMDEEDLELVVEQGKKLYPAWKQMPGVSQKGLAGLQEVIVSAELRLRAMQGSVPPPDDAPPPTEGPENFDPATGEVLS